MSEGDEVPVEGALIDVASFGIAGSEGEVEGAAHLFVVENLAGGLGNGTVGSEGNLADSAGAFILVEHVDQEILALFGGDLGSATFFHDDPCVPNGVALVDTTVIEKHHAIRAAVFGIQIRTGVDFTVGEIFSARAGEPAHSRGVYFEVGAGRGFEVKLASGHEFSGKLALPTVQAFPE